MTEKLLLVDGSSLLFRGFYALPLLSNEQGEFTNGVLGMATMLTSFIDEQKPDKICVAFDKSRKTFRNEIFTEYKGTRGETPAELIPQFDMAKEMLGAMGIFNYDTEGFEADDIIGTLTKKAEAEGVEVTILTGDRDQLQLISPMVNVVLTKKGISETQVWNTSTMEENYGLTPDEFIDLKALMGDSSDNIPGVRGIGEKTALKLLSEYRNIENLYENIDNITPPGTQKKLIEGRDMAFLSKTLATIHCDVPELSLAQCDFDNYHTDELRSFYERVGFKRLLAKMPAGDKKDATPQIQIAINSKTVDAEEMLQAFAGKNHLSCYLQAEKNTPLFFGISDGETALQTSFANLPKLKAILENESIIKDFWQMKETLRLLRSNDIEIKGTGDDGELIAYLLDPGAKDYNINSLAADYGLPMSHDAGSLALITMKLTEKLKHELNDFGMAKLYKDMELPLNAVLLDMENSGIRVNANTLEDLNCLLSAREEELTEEIYKLSGENFNINSPKQLGVVLFEKLSLPTGKKTKTGYSTNSDVLSDLLEAHPIIPLILEFRTVAKLRSTYAEGLQSLIEQDGKIHTHFNQTVTATGRLSSTEPNLQNIPVREELGRELRRAFTAEEGCTLLAADYSQVELRILAHISGDEKMQSAFMNELDIHTATAAEVFGVDLDDVTKEQRRRAKAVNFGIIYGISDYGLSRDLGISRKEAKEYIDMYLSRYPAVAGYMKDIVTYAKENGEVKTLLDRRRILPDIHSKNFNLRSFSERMALNAPIQGTAADIMKIAMLGVQEALKSGGFKAKMLLQVHDELILNVPTNELPQVAKLLKKEMSEAFTLNVPLAVDVKSGPNWHEMKLMQEV